jgi:hypothetical protein
MSVASYAARTAVVAAAGWLLVVGCNVYADPIDNGSFTFGGAPSAAVLDSSPDAGHFTWCPPDRPVDDSVCNIPGSVCEYGETPDITCNPRVECVESAVPTDGTGSLPPAWLTSPAVGGCVVHTCPTAFTDVHPGDSCDGPDGGTVTEYLCGYPQGVCGCTTGPDGSHVHARRWDCAPLPPAPCPAERPHIGQTCSSGGLTCDYGSCIFNHGTAVRCDGNAWQATEVTCN